MSVDFTKPIATADRAQNLTDTRDTLVATAKLLDDTTPTGVASGMIRWSSTNNKFQKYNGTSWVDLASTFAINVSSFGGQAASYYTNITARLGYTPVNKAGDTMTGPLVLNADPSATLGAATKGYVDTGLSGKAAAAHAHAWSAIQYKGLAEGSNADDPNTTQYHNLVTNHANTPNPTYYWHITTTFYGSLTGNRAQIAIQYSDGAQVYARSYYGGVWQPWVRCDLGEGLTRSIGTSGYAKIPGAGGLITQWGYWTNASTSGNVTFPVAFPSTAFAVTVVDGTYFNGGHQTYVPSMNQSGFTWARGSPAASATSYWIAVGV